jgi:hypothetical protein
LYYALCRFEAELAGERVMANRAPLAWDRIEADWPIFEPLTHVRKAAVAGHDVRETEDTSATLRT